MIRASPAHPQEELDKRQLVYCMRIISVGCGTVATLYARSIPNALRVAPPKDEQVMLEIFRGS
jgi:hypothetical protein